MASWPVQLLLLSTVSGKSGSMHSRTAAKRLARKFGLQIRSARRLLLALSFAAVAGPDQDLDDREILHDIQVRGT